MTRVAIIIMGLLLASCDQRKPAISKDAQAESYLREIQAAHPGMTDACVGRMRSDKIAIGDALNDPDCYDLSPPQRWSGLWETGWEWTNFCPDPAKECDWMAKRGIWMTFAKDAYRGPEPLEGIYHIEFVGRRTKEPGNFGHMASYDYLMVVDRVISIKTIPGEKYVKRH